jgi:hypothetical protein
MKWIAGVALAEVIIGSCIVLGGADDTPRTRHSQQGTEYQTDVSQDTLTDTVGRIVSAPTPLKHPSRLDVTHKPSSHPKPTDIAAKIGYEQVSLPDRNIAAPSRSGMLLRRALAANKFYDISHVDCLVASEPDKHKSIVTDPVRPELKTALADANFAIIGINGGKNFTSNQCLAQQRQLVPNSDFYVNTAYPGYAVAKKYANVLGCMSADRICVAQNYGVQAGRYALGIARKADVSVAKDTTVWLDVEESNDWEKLDQNPMSALENRASLEGEAAAIAAANDNIRIGYYSGPPNTHKPSSRGIWARITGLNNSNGLLVGWQNLKPAWIATGSGNYSQALVACSTRGSFNGGVAEFSQYEETINVVIDKKPSSIVLDANARC